MQNREVVGISPAGPLKKRLFAAFEPFGFRQGGSELEGISGHKVPENQRITYAKQNGGVSMEVRVLGGSQQRKTTAKKIAAQGQTLGSPGLKPSMGLQTSSKDMGARDSA